MFKKFAALAAAAALSLGVMTGCGASGTTADSTGYSAENPLVLTLAHGLSETHTVHIAMTQFADEVAEKTDGRIQVKIFPNGQLGSENENLEQLQAGVIAMTKVSAPGLATYNDAFNTFGLPYIFNDTDDFYHVMDSQEMQDFFLSTGDDGFVTLTYYTSGARSFYTKDRAIRTPADLKGLKIRVQDMKSQTDMMSYLGGIPVAMSYGDVYTSLQTGIIDGTENNETALTTGKHGEVCKVYSVDQHAMIPDVLIMSEKVWETISPEDQEIILEAAHDSTDAHKVMWDTAVEEAVKEAQETMGVEFVYDVDKEAFREATQPMIEAYEGAVSRRQDAAGYHRSRKRGGVSHEKHLCCHQILDGQNFEHCLRRAAYLYDGAGSDSGFLPLYPQQPRRFHRGACPLQPDLDRFHRRGLRLLHPGAHVPDPHPRQVHRQGAHRPAGGSSTA